VYQESALLGLPLVVVSDPSSKLTVIWLLIGFFGGAKGYSWKTNQFGLAIDIIESYELVLPDGTIQSVTPHDEDLWFALRVCNIVIYLIAFHIGY
jgi:hypothetical protein